MSITKSYPAYQSPTTITPPTGTFKINVSIFGQGGLAGQSVVSGSTVYYGGSGSGAGLLIGTGISFTPSSQITLSQSNGQVVVDFGGLGTAYVNNGGNGGDATSSSGGSAGEAITTNNIIPNLSGTWTNYLGTNGQAGGSSDVMPFPTPPTVGGIVNNTAYTAGGYAGGQSYSQLLGYWTATPIQNASMIITYFIV
jgi:hypothetical protein